MERSEERFSRNAETEIYTLSLHDALPIWVKGWCQTRYDLIFPNSWCVNNPVISYDSIRLLLNGEIGRAVQQECRDRDLHSFPTRRSSDLGERLVSNSL